MNAWIDPLNGVSAAWLDLLLRASWQGGIVLALVWLVARFASGLPAAHKVWLWRLAFLKLLAGLIWFTPVLLPVLPQQTPDLPVVIEPFPATLAQLADAAAELERGRARPQQPALAVMAMESAATPLPRLVEWLFLAWCAALFICTLRVLRHWLDTRNLLRASRPAGNEAVEDCVRALSERFHLKRAPAIRESPAISSPVLVGIFRPRIILPCGLAESASPSRLELMLAHELAHLRRKDLLWIWLFTVVGALFFFHPLVWLARREWTLATEAACDEMAIRLTRQTPRDYGEMLLDIAAATSRHATPLIAVGIIENAHTLKRRLRLMITTRTRFASIGSVALISIATLALVPWKLTAQEADPEVVAKLKEENKQLRQQLEAMRRDVEKLRADSDQPRNRSDAERQREAAFRREAALQHEINERKIQRARDYARHIERQQRDVERIHAELEELRKRFNGEHPVILEREAQLEKLQADIAAAQAHRNSQDPLDEESQATKAPRLSLKPSSGTKTAFVPLDDRAIKRHDELQAEQRTLLQKEIELVEREMEMTRKNVEAGVQPRSALLAAQRELLDVKLQIAGLSANKDDARAVITQQIEISQKMLKEHKQLEEQGLVPAGSEIPLEREILRLTRKLHELDALEPRGQRQ